jgi:hypothetical protein
VKESMNITTYHNLNPDGCQSLRCGDVLLMNEVNGLEGSSVMVRIVIRERVRRVNHTG